MRPTWPTLDLRLLRDLQCAIEPDPQVSNGTLDLGMAERDLDGCQVFGASVDQRRLGSSQGVRAIDCRIETDGAHPLTYDPRVLAGRNMRRFSQTAGEQVLLRLQMCSFDPCGDGRSGQLGQFELHGTLGFSPHDHCAGQYLVAVRHFTNAQVHEIAATQLAVDR